MAWPLSSRPFSKSPTVQEELAQFDGGPEASAPLSRRTQDGRKLHQIAGDQLHLAENFLQEASRPKARESLAFGRARARHLERIQNVDIQRDVDLLQALF